ncbi:MAG TPA: hypothetical protein VFB60_24680 [Ktedonobacteraceae bacterium]|nr:hypothetical protein [Ktedonobacteraceae bacterium]
MPEKQHQREDEKKGHHPDLRVGKRVICRAFLPTITLLGTLQGIVRYANGVDIGTYSPMGR